MKLVHPVPEKGIFANSSSNNIQNNLNFRPKDPSSSSSDSDLPEIPGTKYPWRFLEDRPTADISEPGPSNAEKRYIVFS